MMNTHSFYLSFGFLILLALAVSGCASSRPTMSASELEVLIEKIEEHEVVAYPRSAESLIDELNTTEPDNDLRFTIARQRAGAPLPDTDDIIKLAEFHYKRGQARSFIGQYAKARDDYQIVIDTMLENGSIGEVRSRDVVLGHAYMSFLLGDIALAKEYLSYSKSFSYGWNKYSDNNHTVIINASLGEYEKSELLLEETSNFLADKKMSDISRHHWGHNKTGMMELEFSKGNYARAREYLLEAYTLYEGNFWGEFGYMPYLTMRLAETYLYEHKLFEAEYYSRKALHDVLKSHGKDSPLTGMILSNLAIVYAQQNKLQDASLIAEEADGIFESAGVKNTSYLTSRNVMVKVAIALLEKDWEAVALLAEAAEADMQGVKAETIFDSWMWASIDVNAAAACIIMDRGDEAIRHLRRYADFSRRVFGESSFQYGEAALLMASAHYANGDVVRASELFEQYLPAIIDGYREGVSNINARVSQVRMRVVVEMYLSFLLEFKKDASQDTLWTALLVSDLVKHSTASESLLDSVARVSSGDGEVAGIVEAIQENDRKITALRKVKARQYVHDSAEPVRQYIDKEIELLQEVRAELRERLSASGQKLMDYTGLSDRDHSAPTLGFKESLVAAFVGEKKTTMWVYASNRLNAYDIPMGRPVVDRVVAELKEPFSLSSIESGERLYDYDVTLAYDFYSVLLGPAESYLEDKESIVYIPDGSLASLPLQILATEKYDLPASNEKYKYAEYRGVPWLLNKYSVSVMPSYVSFVALKKRHKVSLSESPSFLGVGDPIFTLGNSDQIGSELQQEPGDVSFPNGESKQSYTIADLPSLPETTIELRAIASIFGEENSTLLLNEKANESVLREADLSRYDVISFATHGLMPGDLDGLQEPALALSNPSAVNVLGDGLLTMSEVMAMDFNTNWVLLSACNTAAPADQGEEFFSGLASAFFYSGSLSLLVSYWPVDSYATVKLTTHLVDIQQNSDPNQSRALQKSMMLLINSPGLRSENGEVVNTYAHPYFWAPYSLIGAYR